MVVGLMAVCGGRKASGRECVSGRQVSLGPILKVVLGPGRLSDGQPPVACPPAPLSPTRVAHLACLAAWLPPGGFAKKPDDSLPSTPLLCWPLGWGWARGATSHAPQDSWLSCIPRRQKVHGPLYALYTQATTTLSGQPLFACINNNSAQQHVRATRYLVGTPPRALQPS